MMPNTMQYPSEWSKKKFENFATLQRGKDLPVQSRETGSFPILGSNGICGYHNDFVSEGPGVVTGRSGSVGGSYYVEGRFWPLNTALWVKHFHGNFPLFVHYFFQSFDFARFKGGVSVPTLNRNLFSNELVTIPAIPEQRSIAEVLAKIQEAIAAHQETIDKTWELKKALMAKLFTEGLRGEATKETEIGSVPESWDSVEIRQLGKIVTGNTPPTKNQEYYEGGGFQFISPADLGTTKYVYSTGKEISALGLEVSRNLPKDTVLSVCIGSTIGKVGMTLMESSATNQQINAIICSDDYNPHFICYALEKASDYIRSLSTPSPVPILSKGKFQAAKLAIPPKIDEQNAIAEILSALDAKIEAAENKKEPLQDLFKTMLHEIMTGNIRTTHLMEA